MENKEVAMKVDEKELVKKLLATSIISALKRFEENTMMYIISSIETMFNSVNPFYVVSPEGLPQICSTVFINNDFRDFIFSTTTIFIANMDDAEYSFTRLTRDIATSVSIFKPDSKKVPVPNEIKQRFVSFDEILEVLTDNKWLVTVLMLIIYLDSTELEKLSK